MSRLDLDYRLLEALFYIDQTRSFEKAAKKLCITQSAVSQRIRQLEIQTECRLIVRSTPVSLTSTGESLSAHFRRVRFLENQWRSGHLPAARTPGKIAIAANRDSLSTWLPGALSEFAKKTGIMLEVWSEDQSRTLELLSSGKVEACISSDPGAPKGYDTVSLGTMDYHCVATPGFIRKYFSENLPESLTKAPVVIFDRFDHLHNIFLEENMGFKGSGLTFPYHELPSHHAFLKVITDGLCYGMIPLQEIAHLLETNLLQDVFPGHSYTLPLYLHSWTFARKELKQLVEIFEDSAASFLL